MNEAGTLNNSMNVTLPLKAAHPKGKLNSSEEGNQSQTYDVQSGLRSTSSKLINTSNLRLA